MNDHFRALTKIRAPSEWPDLEGLEPRPLPSPHELGEPTPHRIGTPSVQGHRVAAAMLAFVVAAVGVGFAIWAFGGASRSPRPRPAATVGNGKIAFVRAADQANTIELLEPDGTNAVRFVRGSSPAWSPDGSRLAFVLAGAGDGRTIATVGLDGAIVGLVPLEGQPGGLGPQAWSPDGTRLVYASPDGIHVMNSDGSGSQLVTHYVGEHACYDLQPAWSPSGERIVFAVLCEGGNEGLWTVNVDGSDRRPLISGDYELDEYRAPVWSPDGSKVAFVKTDWRLDDAIRGAAVLTVDADGTGTTRVAGSVAFDRSIAWSPDGRFIAFTRYHEGGSDIFVADVQSGEASQLTHSGDAADPAWQPVLPGTPSPRPSMSAVVAATTTVGADGAVRSVAYGEGAVWVAVTGEPSGGGTILRIDAETDEVVAAISVAAVPGWEVGGAGLTIGAGSVWVTGSVEDPGDRPIGTDAVLVRIDPATNEVAAAIPFGDGSGGDVAVDEGGVWVVIGGDKRGQLVRIDPATNEVVARIPIRHEAAPYQDLRQVVTVGGVVLVTQPTFDNGGSAITAVDAATSQVLGTAVVRVPEDLNPSIGPLVVRNGEVWADNGFRLVRIDPWTGQLLDGAVELPEALAAGTAHVRRAGTVVHRLQRAHWVRTEDAVAARSGDGPGPGVRRGAGDRPERDGCRPGRDLDSGLPRHADAYRASLRHGPVAD